MGCRATKVPCKGKIKLQLDFALRYVTSPSPPLIKSQWEEAAGRRKHQKDYTNRSCARSCYLAAPSGSRAELSSSSSRKPPVPRRAVRTSSPLCLQHRPQSSHSLLPGTPLLPLDGTAPTRPRSPKKGLALENLKFPFSRTSLPLTMEQFEQKPLAEHPDAGQDNFGEEWVLLLPCWPQGTRRPCRGPG